ncbi:hypothetical protein ONZ45_g10560 [Pleurotus djamor]|nr:hypothetical protein ONZ45_g10560 [Pleurotus djamor]
MHLVFENLMKNLIALWTGNFKGITTGTEDYQLHPKVWEAIGEATASAGSSIPSSFAARPPNIADDKIALTADSLSFWMQHLGPPLLARRFSQTKYYTHFIKLVKLVKLCLQFEITRDEIVQIRIGFRQWVCEYERIYYQGNPARLPTCPLTIHALLHIADDIEQIGPVWTYWTFPTERYCGRLQRGIKSRRHPFANLDNFVLAHARLSQIRIIYRLGNQLNLSPTIGIARQGFSTIEYPSCMLLPPSRPSDTVAKASRDKIIIVLSTRFSKTVPIIRKEVQFDGHIKRWACIRRLEGGDDMHASSFAAYQEDRRDATYVRYDMLVDINAHRRRARSEFELRPFFGQLEDVFVLHLPANATLGIPTPTTIILAAIWCCETLDSPADGMGMPYYERMGRREVVDAACVQCLVGRVKVRDGWGIIDRSSQVNRALYVPDD